MLSLLFSILQSQVKKFLSCVSPCAAETLLRFGRTSQIRTGDLYHVKAHRTRHNTLGLVEINTGGPPPCFSICFAEDLSERGEGLVSGPVNP
jgi:hypothetical protein